MPESTTAEETTTLPNFFAIKMGVSDFERSAEFYGKLFGMTLGPAWEKVGLERALQWAGPGHGPTIIMFSDKMAAERGLSEEGMTDPVLREIVGGRHPFKTGSSWTVFQVPDIDVVANQLSGMGLPSDVRDVGELGFNMRIIMTTDPDGNVLEITQAY